MRAGSVTSEAIRSRPTPLATAHVGLFRGCRYGSIADKEHGMKNLIGVSTIEMLVVSAVLMSGQTQVQAQTASPFAVGGCAQVNVLPFTPGASHTAY